MDSQSQRTDHAATFLEQGITRRITNLPDHVKEQAQEIRLRVDNPLCLHTGSGPLFVKEGGGVTSRADSDCHCVSPQELEESFRRLCGYSVHSHQDEITHGYVSVSGGHRAGLCGRAVIGEGGEARGLREFTSINLRIAREVKGAADELINLMGREGLGGMILAGPPSSGKTTLLRDLTRQLSSGALGTPLKVSVIDERGELSALHNGRIENDLGPCTDVLCGFGKSEAILMAVRTLSPQVIVCDEIGAMDEIEAVRAGLNCGAVVITTLHANDAQQLLRRPQLAPLLATGAFERVVVLQGAGAPSQIESIREVGTLYD